MRKRLFFSAAVLLILLPLWGQYGTVELDPALRQREAMNSVLGYSEIIQSKYGPSVLYTSDPDLQLVFNGQSVVMQITMYPGGMYFVCVGGDGGVGVLRVSAYDPENKEVEPLSRDEKVGPNDYVVFTTPANQTAVYKIRMTLEYASGRDGYVSWVTGEIDAELADQYSSGGGGGGSSSQYQYDGYGNY